MCEPFQFIIRLERRATFHDKIDLESLHQVTGSGDRQEGGQTLPFSRRRGCCQNIYFWYFRSEEQQVSGVHVVNLQWYTESDWTGAVSIKVCVQSIRLVALYANDDEVTFLISKRSQHRTDQFCLRITGYRLLRGDLHILHRYTNIRDYLAGDANRAGIPNSHDNISARVATFHVSNLTTHQILTVQFVGVGYLRLAISVVAITKIPVDAKGVPVGVHRASVKDHLVPLINKGLGSCQLHLR